MARNPNITKDKYYISNPIGIHRIMGLPYDDSECFESIDALLEYCNTNSTWYNGQKVCCIFGNDDPVAIPHIQGFTIMNGMPLLNFNNLELKRKEDDRQFVQVYYYNPSLLGSNNLRMTKDGKRHSVYLEDPLKFSILDYIKILTNGADTVYFSGYIINCSTGEKTEFDFNYDKINGSPFWTNALNYSDSNLATNIPNNLRNGCIINNALSNSNNGLYSLLFSHDSSNIFVNLIPRNNTSVNKNYIVSIYVKMSNSYYYAMGARE